jgi:hypothetical protein
MTVSAPIPDEGELRLGTVELPVGRLVRSQGGEGEPVAWTPGCRSPPSIGCSVTSPPGGSRRGRPPRKSLMLPPGTSGGIDGGGKAVEDDGEHPGGHLFTGVLADGGPGHADQQRVDLGQFGVVADDASLLGSLE